MSASRMNKAFIVFLKELTMEDHLFECGVAVRDNFIPILPLSNRSKKVILSNVPPFIPDDMLERILVRYGKIVGSMKMILKNPNLKHIVSFRRQIFMILSDEYQELNVAVRLTVLGKDYTIFITFDTMRCFVCGKHGHSRLTCPTKKDAEQVNHGNESVTADAQVILLLLKPKKLISTLKKLVMVLVKLVRLVVSRTLMWSPLCHGRTQVRPKCGG